MKNGLTLFLSLLLCCSYQHGRAQFAGGDGSSANPYQITNLQELDSVRLYLNKHFVLMNDLNVAASKAMNVLNNRGFWQDSTQYAKNDFVQIQNGQAVNSYYCLYAHKSAGSIELAKWQLTTLNAGDTLGFEPIGWAPNPLNNTLPQEAPFTGSFDGRGFSIDSLFINRPNEQNVGLFGLVNSPNASIKNLEVKNADVTGGWCVGILAGFNRAGEVAFCHSSGNVKGIGDAGAMGGLVGRNGWAPATTAHINYSYSNANISGYRSSASAYFGGLTGVNNGDIANSYARGSVSGSFRVGGLSGNNYGGRIVNCYSTGGVSAAGTKGGLVGDHQYTVSNSYWDTQTSGVLSSAGGMGKTSIEMTYPYDPSSFVGWDFRTLWRPDSTGTINDGYPYLCPVEQTTEHKVACNKYRWRDGILYTASTNTAEIILPNVARFSCDSLITLNLQIIEIDTSVRDESKTAQRRLVSNARNKQYQWFEFLAGSFNILAGENDSIFRPADNVNGDFGVIVSDSLCSDTSKSFMVQRNPPSGVAEWMNALRVFPNPSNGVFYVESAHASVLPTELLIRDALGRVIERYEFREDSNASYELIGEKGLYFIEMRTSEHTKTLKLLKL